MRIRFSCSPWCKDTTREDRRSSSSAAKRAHLLPSCSCRSSASRMSMAASDALTTSGSSGSFAISAFFPCSARTATTATHQVHDCASDGVADARRDRGWRTGVSVEAHWIRQLAAGPTGQSVWRFRPRVRPGLSVGCARSCFQHGCLRARPAQIAASRLHDRHIAGKAAQVGGFAGWSAGWADCGQVWAKPHQSAGLRSGRGRCRGPRAAAAESVSRLRSGRSRGRSPGTHRAAASQWPTAQHSSDRRGVSAAGQDLSG